MSLGGEAPSVIERSVEVLRVDPAELGQDNVMGRASSSVTPAYSMEQIRAFLGDEAVDRKREVFQGWREAGQVHSER